MFRRATRVLRERCVACAAKMLDEEGEETAPGYGRGGDVGGGEGEEGLGGEVVRLGERKRARVQGLGT